MLVLLTRRSCRYFYWRLRRRLQEEAAMKRLAVADPTLSRDARMALINSAISTADLDLHHDQAVTLALEKSKAAIDVKVKDARSSSISEAIMSMSNEDHGAVVEGLKRALGQRLSGEDLAVSFLRVVLPISLD